MWTKFYDMYSGGSQKEDWSEIYIQASSEEEAIKIFERRFDHHPHRVTCDCCGEDYSISSEKELSNITAFNRNCPWIYEKGKSLEGRYLEGNGKGKGKNVPSEASKTLFAYESFWI